MKAAKGSPETVFTLHEVLALTERVRRLSHSWWALGLFLLLTALLLAACIVLPLLVAAKVPSRGTLAEHTVLATELNGARAEAAELARASTEIMAARIALSEQWLEWRAREVPANPDLAKLESPQDLRALLDAREATLAEAEGRSTEITARLRELQEKIVVEETRLSQQLGRAGPALENELRVYMEKRSTIQEDKRLADEESALLQVAIQELTDQLLRSGVPKEELGNLRAYMQHLENQARQAQQRRSGAR